MASPNRLLVVDGEPGISWVITQLFLGLVRGKALHQQDGYEPLLLVEQRKRLVDLFRQPFCVSLDASRTGKLRRSGCNFHPMPRCQLRGSEIASILV